MDEIQDASRASAAITIPDSTPGPDVKTEIDEPLARRPATLTVGKASKVGVNAFQVVKLPSFMVYHYDVQIAPLKKAQSTRRESDKDLPPEVSRKVVEYMVDRSKMFGDVHVGFDGKRNLYAPSKLAEGDEKPFDVQHWELQIPDDDAPETNGHSNGRSNGYANGHSNGSNGHSNGTNGDSEKPRGQGFTVRMKAVGLIDLSDLERFLGGNASSTEGVQLSLMALNVLINTMPASAYPSKKTSFFPPDIQRDATSQHAAGGGGGRGGRGGRGRGGGRGGGPPPPTLSHAFALSKGIEVWRGYFTSLRPTLGKLIVNVDVTHQPFVSAGSMISVALAITGGIDPRNLATEMNDRRRSWVELERVLRGSQISARFGTNTTDVHRRKIKELGKVGANKQIFEYGGQRMSVADYWKTTYNRSLQYPDLPCIRVSATAWYPIEVCDLMIGNKYNKTLSPDQVAQAIKFTTVKPRERMDFIKKIQFLRPSTNPALTAWGMNFAENPMSVDARILDPPTIKLKGSRSRTDQTTRPAEGQWNMQRPDQLSFFRPATLNYWAVVVFKQERNSFFATREAQQSISELCRAMSALGMDVTNTAPRIYFTENEDYNDVPRIFKSIGKDHFQQYNAVPQLIVCYLAKQNCPDYAQIKQFGDVEHGVATQCMSIEKVKNKGNNVYYSNVALKINPKLAGINQILDSGALQGFDDVPSMIFGADVTHPPPDSRDPSVSALVGSMDRYAATYGTTTRIQSSRQENIEGLEDMCFDLLNMFEQKNKRKPQRIIVYRDGVSEGQFQIVLRKEVSAFRAALKRFSSDPIKITYIVAAKRHHFRFFPENDRDAERSGNVKAGTVIDRDITDPTSWDWYLQSHGGLLGTSRSTHYTVLLDENNFSADRITSLSYNLCYLYARSTRSVSIVTPCYYAHHACVRAKLLSQPTNDDAHSSFSNASRGSQESAERAKQLAAFNKNLKPLHSKIHDTLYFL